MTLIRRVGTYSKICRDSSQRSMCIAAFVVWIKVVGVAFKNTSLLLILGYLLEMLTGTSVLGRLNDDDAFGQNAIV